jgi:hypothetical protein
VACGSCYSFLSVPKTREGTQKNDQGREGDCRPKDPEVYTRS